MGLGNVLALWLGIDFTLAMLAFASTLTLFS